MIEKEKRVITDPEKELPLTAIGISNLILANYKLWIKKDYRRLYESPHQRYFFNVQFYDFDGIPTKEELNQILALFDNDCIEYDSGKGRHFISFAICKGKSYCLKRAVELSAKLNQDYAMETNLVLRISEKWLNGNPVRERPIFKKVHKPPMKNLIISRRHFAMYSEFLNLPEFVRDIYKRQTCIMIDGQVRLFRYRTRHKTYEDEQFKYPPFETNDYNRDNDEDDIYNEFEGGYY